MPDYDSLLRTIIARHSPDSEAARQATYDRARQSVVGQLRAAEPPWSDDDIAAEQAALEAAILRVEAEFSATPTAPREDAEFSYTGFERQRRRRRSRRTALVAAVAAASIVAIAGVLYVTGPSIFLRKSPGLASTSAKFTEFGPAAEADAADTGLPYPYRRQPVYYRTTHPVGTVVIDRSQRFLYVIQPNVVAMRYGFGIGRECGAAAGLRRVTRKEEWPEWRPVRQLIGSGSYPEHVAGGPGSPLGARALHLESDYDRITAPTSPRRSDSRWCSAAFA